MLTDYQKFQLPDQNDNKNIVAEVNYSEDPNVKECQIVKFICPNGDKVFVKRDHLNQILFAIGKAEDQRKMIPQKIHTVHWFETVLGVKATKDIRKGEMINFPIKASVPCTYVKELIGEAKFKDDYKQETKNKSGIITPA